MSPPDREACRRLPPGTLLAGRFRIVHLLGRGSMGEVYRAEDLKLEQEVALKFLPASRAGDEAWLSRFLDEVRLARQIAHPHVCRVYDAGEVAGLHFLSMEWVPGDDLEQLLGRIGRLPLGKALEAGRQIASGLAAAHDLGILHRDLKPANVMLDARGQARILDFGLAALSEDGAASGWGTPAYLAPERLAGGAATVATDLYALGLLLYRMICGRPAFGGGSLAELAAARREAPVAPALLADGLDPAAEAALLACLAFESAARPASALEVAAALAPDAGAGAPEPWRPEEGAEVPGRPHWVWRQKLAAGGFSEVWLAVHEKTGEPRAFKLAAGAEGLAALEREVTVFRLLRQTLGARDDLYRILDWSLAHPPYFVEMEYTSPGSLVDWAESQGGLGRIPLGERLEIVAQVAAALSAVHAAGVLHQDVKPANVLIERTAGGALQARLGDFGLGRVTDRERLLAAGITVGSLEGGDAPATEGSSLAGTRLYLAPELLEGKPASPRSDLYALGVLLYQMGVGDFSRALASGWEREVGDELLAEDIAAAVDGSPERRLGDAGELADRLRRLDGRRHERAARQRAGEQLRRLRHRQRLAAAAALGLALLAGALAFHVRGVSREAAATRRVADFLAELLVAPPTSGIAAREVALREVLDRGARRLDRGLAGSPEIEARLRHTLGVAYGQLGLEPRGREELEKALALRRRRAGGEAELADTLLALAALAGSGRDGRREALAREALALRARLFGTRHAQVAEGQAVLGGILYETGRYGAAETAYRQALEVYREKGGEPLREAAVWRDLAAVLAAREDIPLARAYLQQALAIYHRRLGREHVEIADTLNLLAILEQQQGNHAAAIRLFEEVLVMKRRLLGERHPHLVSSFAYLGEAHLRNGNLDAAEALFRQALAQRGGTAEEGDPTIRGIRHQLERIRLRRAAGEGAGGGVSSLPLHSEHSVRSTPRGGPKP